VVRGRLALFAELLKNQPVTWSGTTRTPLENQTLYPRIESGRLRAWVGVGGSPESVVRAARYGLPLTLAIIGGNPRRFRPYVDLYHESLTRFGQPCSRSPFIPRAMSPTPTSVLARSCGRTIRRC
jgi:alkanesulfonate monooxygenase SsuD/methylene tetrahydromethanopterin reductase-like flavin-dependent oxidoreductase (luciferase family)